MGSTLKDVAALSGVHPSTVSRVLRKKENLKISKSTQDRIFAAVKELNYQPDHVARSLRLGKSFTIGLIVPDISNPFFARISRRIENMGFEEGYTVIVCNTDEDQEKEIIFLNQLISRGVDGIIMTPVQESSEHIRELIDKNYPLVLIDRIFDDLKVSAVISNNEESAYNAVVHLVELGHKRIAFLRGRKNIYSIKKRLEGYYRAAKEFNLLDVDSLVVGDGFELENGYEAFIEVLNRPVRPTAIVSGGNLISIGAIKAILEKGLSIPEDISIIAFADSFFSPYLVTPLTTITHLRKEIGEKAFQLLLNQINSDEPVPPKVECIDTSFELRESTGRIN